MMQRDDLRTELFSEENIHAAAELAKRCFSSPWSEEIYRRELENPQSVGFVCMCGERAVGMIHCNFVLDELTLNTLCVDAAFRRQGIARALFANVREMMQGICTVCYLEVRESNFPARALYESLGFVQNGFRPRYYSNPEEAAVLMAAPLGE
ncbi:MAG: ribosomal protein S18-alanine N-acetyltransferase [Oscillospiraceae bacterium]|nr:ribosomal protein S18-alanine N-acetyltransferase [Oscillospiraceae bacterium]